VGRDVAVALHELVDKQGTDLIVLSAHGYSGASRWPYGSVATNLISYGNTPILMIQDLSRQDIRLSSAELATQEHQGH
jgi:nucleotide-binding universal stress UspA family protein